MKNYTKPEFMVNEFESMDVIHTSSQEGLIDGGAEGNMGEGTIIIPDPEPQSKKYWGK